MSRAIMDSGEIILYRHGENNIVQPCKFTVTGLISDKGSSSVVYNAYHEHSSNLGVLYEFYPKECVDVLERRRNESPVLVLNTTSGLEKDCEDFKRARDRYIKTRDILKNIRITSEFIKKDDREDTAQKNVDSFLLPTETFYSTENEGKSTIYVWTPEPKVKSFFDLCKDIHKDVSKRPQYNLFQIIAAIKSLTECVARLHENGLVHCDINPNNFGFSERGGVLTESITLFDTDNIYDPTDKDDNRCVWTDGYGDPRVRVHGNKNDIYSDFYAVGATLYFGLTSELYDDENYENLGEILKSSRIFTISEDNAAPRLRYYITKFLEGCLSKKTTMYHGKRYYNASEMLRDIKKALYYIWPAGAVGRHRYDRWRLNDVKRFLDLTEEKNSRLKMQRLLYDYPLYRMIDKKEDVKCIKVLVIGLAKYGATFLDLALQVAQIPDYKIEVTVIIDDVADDTKSDWDLYIEERPLLPGFFDIGNKDAGEKSYGRIRCEVEKTEFEDLIHDKDNITDLKQKYSECGCVFIDTGDDALNEEYAKTFNSCDRYVFYVNEEMDGGEDSQNEKDTIAVRVSAASSKDINKDSLEHLAFNTHLVWDNNPNISLEDKEKRFQLEYNHDASVSFALSLKYKLFGMGIDIDDSDLDEAAYRYHKLIQGNGKFGDELACAEHRRWVTEKICLGWRTREIDTCEGVTKDEKTKTHICLVPSDTENCLHAMKKSEWDSDSGIDLNAFDELDRVSVKLHRLYERISKNINIDSFDEIYALLEDEGDISLVFREWHKRLIEVKGGLEQSVSLCRGYYLSFESKLQKVATLSDAQKEQILTKMKNCSDSLLKRYDYTDYKKYDIDLVNRIPFILTWREDVNMIIPLPFSLAEKNKTGDYYVPSNVAFQYLSAAMIVNPTRVVYLYYIDAAKERIEHKARVLDKILNSIKKFLERKNLQSSVEVVLISEDRRILNEFISVRNGNMRVLFGINYTEIVLSDEMALCADVFDCLQNRLRMGSFVIEVHKNAENEWYDRLYREDSFRGNGYCFNSKTREFYDTTEKTRWLEYIRAEIKLNAWDYAFLSAQSFQVNDYAGLDYKNIQSLWHYYRQNTKKWKDCTGSLGEYAKNTGDLIVLNKEDKCDGGEVKPYCAYMPLTCKDVLERLSKFLIRFGYIAPNSSITELTADACKVVFYVIHEEKFDKMFENPIIFERGDNIVMELVGNGRAKIRYSPLRAETSYGKDRKSLYKWLMKNRFIHSVSAVDNRGYIWLTYGSPRIRDILTCEGRLLEAYVYHQTIISGYFEEVSSEMVIHRNDFNADAELDCVIIRGFVSVIVECKASDDVANRKEEFERVVRRLYEVVGKYGINAKGLLLIDTQMELNYVDEPSIQGCLQRVDVVRLMDIEKKNSRNPVSEKIKEIIESIEREER